MGIFLYILNHYPMTEPVSVMNIKIRSTLIMLKRVGIVENVGEGMFLRRILLKSFVKLISLRKSYWEMKIFHFTQMGFFSAKLKSRIFFFKIMKSISRHEIFIV